MCPDAHALTWTGPNGGTADTDAEGTADADDGDNDFAINKVCSRERGTEEDLR